MAEHSYTVAIHDGGFAVTLTLPLSKELNAQAAHEAARLAEQAADALLREQHRAEQAERRATEMEEERDRSRRAAWAGGAET